MKTFKRILIGTALGGLLLGALCFLLFTMTDMPQPSATSTSSGGHSVALVLRWCRPETLKPGMIVVVQAVNQPERRLCRIEAIQEPDPSERVKAGRRRGRRVAQALLDMEFRPRYVVSPVNTNEPKELIYESQIKGKIVHVFERK
jgi:hypothetical protein